MATSKITSPNATTVSLASGAKLTRDGNKRILHLNGYMRSTILNIPSADKPKEMAVGCVVRGNGTAYIALAQIQVNTDGSLTFYVSGGYNNNSGWSLAQGSDIFYGQVFWTV